MKENVNIRFLLLLSFYVVYLCIGAAVFSAIEGPIIILSDAKRTKLASVIGDFLAQHQCVNHYDLNDFMKEIVTANEMGVSATNNVTEPANWNFAASLFFSATVVTTIGYGRVTPLSNYGKGFCIFYAVLGLPLTLLVIGVAVERLSVLTSHFLDCLNRQLGQKVKAFTIQLIHVSILGFLFLVFFYLIPALIFCILEIEWSYLDAIYFCFISLTTIGLGDYIPGEHPQDYRNLYKVCVVAYLILGLICMVLLVELIVQIPEFNAGLLFMVPKKQGVNGSSEESDHLTNSSHTPPVMYTMNTSINQGPDDAEEKPLTQSQEN
ncbi:potassium channel subfamily K member 1-like [Glandiceps talaboti]